MAKFEHQHKHATLKKFGEPPIDASTRARVNTDEYEVNPILLDMLHNKKIFVGENDTVYLYARLN
jgi:hypothetical protein